MTMSIVTGPGIIPLISKNELDVIESLYPPVVVNIQFLDISLALAN
jgi:hypothetical protein